MKFEGVNNKQKRQLYSKQQRRVTLTREESPTHCSDIQRLGEVDLQKYKKNSNFKVVSLLTKDEA